MIIVSADAARVRQPDRPGEVLIGSEIEPYTSYSQESTLGFLEMTAEHTLELLPILGRVRVLRAVGGPVRHDARLQPDHGRDRGRGVLRRRRLGTYGFKATTICGVTMAELVDTGRVPS